MGPQSRWGCRLAAAALALTTGALHAGAARADGPSFGPPTLVSVGDSIASGEGGRWAGNIGGPLSTDHDAADALGPYAYADEARGYDELIPGCHRSRASEIHIGRVVSANFACSGASTQTVVRLLGFRPGIDFYRFQSGIVEDPRLSHRWGQALLLQEYAREHNVKLVLVSIGGNDINIGGVVVECGTRFAFNVRPFCGDDPGLQSDVERRLRTLTGRIVTALQNVHLAMHNAGYRGGYRIVLQDYAVGLPVAGDFRYAGRDRWTRGGCPFSDDDATWLNALAARLNLRVHAAVHAARLSNVVWLDISDALHGHRLCQLGVSKLEEEELRWDDPGAAGRLEWLTQVHDRAPPYKREESLHPNYFGQLALRNCLRLAWNGGRVRGGTCVQDPRRLAPPGPDDGPRMVLR